MARTPEIDLREDFGRNYIINGAFDFWQRGTSFSIGGGAAYTTDRFLAQEGGTGGFDVLRSSDTPDINTEHSLEIDITTAGTLAAGDINILEHRLEGYDLRYITDKIVTLSFYVKSNVTGIHSVAFQNAANDRSYVSEYTIDSADTWEQKSITLLLDSTGTWDYVNTGLRIRFSIGLGSTFTTSTLDQWQAGDFRASTGHVNIKASDTNYVRFSQVQLLEGTNILPFRKAGRSYGGELQLCQRYFWTPIDLNNTSIQHVAHGRNTSTTDGNLSNEFPVQMRAVPSLITDGTISEFKAHNGTGSADLAISSITASNSSRDRANFNIVTAGSLNAGGACTLRRVGTTAFIAWSADL